MVDQIRQRKSITDSVTSTGSTSKPTKSTKEVTFKVEGEENTETEAIEQMLDDINQKLQESADEIVQVRFALDEPKSELMSQKK